MEPPLTQFIALASYEAQRLSGVDGVSKQVLEKTLAVAIDILGTSIENTETYVHQRGPRTRLARQRLVLDPVTVDLDQITSNYFRRTTDNSPERRGTYYSFTDDFRSRLPRLAASKPYLAEFAAVIDELHGVVRAEGGFVNLLYLSLLKPGYGGVYALVGDLEIMTSTLEEYVRTEIHLVERTRHKKPPEVLRQVREAHAALRKKVSLLRQGDTIRGRLESTCTSITGLTLIRKAVQLPPDCFLWSVVEELAARVRRIGEVLLGGTSDLPVFRLTLVQALEQEVLRLHAPINHPSSGEPGGDRAEELFVELFAAFDRWCRALLGLYDSEYFNAHRRSSATLNTSSNVIVCYDIPRSTEALDQALASSTPTAIQEFTRWRERLAAVVCNWSILFGGKIQKADGDKEIVYFETARGALQSMAMTLSHLDAESHLRALTGRRPVHVRAAIGSGLVLDAGGQESSVAINKGFHAVSALADHKVAAHDSCTSLALDSFAAEHAELEQFVTERVPYRDGVALKLNYERLREEFLTSFLTGGS